MKIHILHIAECAGGVDLYLRMLFANMDREKYANTLICSFDYKQSDYEGIVDEFIQVDMHNAISFGKDFSAIKEVRKLIKQINPDIIYCHSSKAGGIGRIANIGTGIPIVYNPHGWAFTMYVSKMKSFMYLWMERLLSLFTIKFITISNYEKLIAVQKRIAKKERIKSIFNGIDMTYVERQLVGTSITRASLGIPNDAYLIGVVGRITAQKAPDTFVKMAALVKEKVPNAWFMMVGDGDLREKTEQAMADAGLADCFTITGWVHNPITYSALMDVGVLLSHGEGFGLVLVEYMKLGIPIVATEANAIPDLITDHENGLLVNVDDYERAAQEVLELHDNEALRDRLTQNGRARAELLFDVRRTAREHERLFTKIARGGVKCKIKFYAILPLCPMPNRWRVAA